MDGLRGSGGRSEMDDWFVITLLVQREQQCTVDACPTLLVPSMAKMMKSSFQGVDRVWMIMLRAVSHHQRKTGLKMVQLFASRPLGVCDFVSGKSEARRLLVSWPQCPGLRERTHRCEEKPPSHSPVRRRRYSSICHFPDYCRAPTSPAPLRLPSETFNSGCQWIN